MTRVRWFDPDPVHQDYVASRPRLRRCRSDNLAQNLRNRSRCQRITVSGFTYSSEPHHACQPRDRPTQNNRSKVVRTGSLVRSLEDRDLQPEGGILDRDRPHARSTEVEGIGRWTKRGLPSSPIVRLYPVSRQSVPDRPINGERQLEDAVVLAHCLSETRPVEAALRKYEHLRIPRTTAIVQSSWQTGKALQLDSPTLEKFRNWFMGTCLGTRLGGRAFRSLLTYQLPELRSRKHNPSS